MTVGPGSRFKVLPAVLGGAAGLLLWPAHAEAHLVTTGLGPVYDGISHVLTSPDDLVPVLAMSLLAGLNGATAGRRTLFTLTLAWLVGGFVGFAFGRPVLPYGVVAGSFLTLGVLTAVDRRLSPAVVGTVAAALGSLHGWLNGAGIAESQREALGLVGIAAAIFVIVALTAAFVSRLRAGWARIAVRVAGSWVAAIGLLMLGWSLRGA
jgi:hydrogenase/urease accessory protein HupE